MKKMTGHDIKKTWLEFFKSKGHKVEESASLVPINDPTLLWINAGVAPLKGYFDGSKVPNNPRIVNVQKCIRTNDIENVGKTARHHTFFEMLGNFSIGDYFRDEVIPWAVEILTDEKFFGINSDKLFMTVYPTDDETYEKWVEAGIEKSHIIRSYENFWEIGPGPCGPSTEIFYDRGDKYGKADLSLIENDVENDRYVEIWNIVLSQFNAKEGFEREAYPELPNKNIDTGMGLERMATIMQGVETNFETDLIYPVIAEIEKLAGTSYEGQMSFKVIADHIRSVVFALSDGATFSNDGRGYVLRRLLRRALKHGRSLGIKGAFLKGLVDTVVSMMKETYPYLEKTKDFAKKMIEKEETQFLDTLTQGEKILANIMKKEGTIIDGNDAFMLYDTYGFPVELTKEYGESEGMSVDEEGFKQQMAMQKERARNARKNLVGMHDQNEAYLSFKDESFFVGYETTEVKSTIIKVFEDGVVTKETPFYAESGGQISDKGVIVKTGQVFTVEDVQKLPNGQFLHILSDHTLLKGDEVTLHVDEASRKMTEAHHSATHILFSILRETLGEHVMQQGSLVGPEYLRFDFNHYDLPTEKTLLKIEERVNEKINEAIDVNVEKIDLKEAKKRGAVAEFGEKYDDEVRMVNMGVTLDLCGGTHVGNTADIGRFAIVNVESKGSGIYRILGLANGRVPHIREFMRGFESTLSHLEDKAKNILKKAEKETITLKFTPKDAPDVTGSYHDIIAMRHHLEQYQRAVKDLEKTYEIKRQKASLSDLDAYLNQVDENGNLILKLKDVNPKDVKALADRLMEHMKKGVVFLADHTADKLVLVTKSTSDVHAGTLIKEAARIAGGGGGGRPDFAQAGGRDTSKIDDVLAYVKETLDEKTGA
jgi:alanyl-tRNA synthetase